MYEKEFSAPADAPARLPSGPLFVVSDIHGRAANLVPVLRACREEGGRILLLGDLFGRSSSRPWPTVSEQLIEAARAGLSLLAVRGNCDRPSWAEEELPFRFHDRLLLYEGGRMLLATHGHLFGEADPPALAEGALLLTGHTHIPAFRAHGSWFYANPGSLGQGRGGAGESYLVLEGSHLQWRTPAGKTVMEREL